MGNCSSAVANAPVDAQSAAVEAQLKQMEVSYGWGIGAEVFCYIPCYNITVF